MSKLTAEIHTPVLEKEVVDALVTNKSGAYLDVTSGSGGHSARILERLDSAGRLFAVDRDSEAVSQTTAATNAYAGQALVLRGKFSQLVQLAQENRFPPLNGILFDLGMSSYHIDTVARGFSYQSDGPLDMRMSRDSARTAVDLVNDAPEETLARVIKALGEERTAKRIARSISRLRAKQPLVMTSDLRRAVEATAPKMPTKTLARVFQAIRMWVNEELEELEAALRAAKKLLPDRGRVAFIAYHSLEDRQVKAFFGALARGCICPPKVPVCVCGQVPEFTKILRCRASAEEVQRNPRARSAIMRVFERIPNAGRETP